jgi:hypothetical protein
MVKRSAALAIVGACVLALGVSSVVQAVVLHEDFEALIAGWDSNGDPFAQDSSGDPLEVNPDECDAFDVGEGEILFWFVQSGTEQSPVSPNPGGIDENLLDVDLNDGEIFLEDLEANEVEVDGVDWVVTVDPPGDELELVSATSNIDGGELIVAAICMGLFAGAGATDPDTATATRSDPGSPYEAAWLLVVALGVLLASLVVLAPARTSRRSSEDAE